MTDAPSLFDAATRALRLDRAARGWGAADFLHRFAAGELADRLSDVARPFAVAGVLGTGGGAYAAAIAGRKGGLRTLQADVSPRLAAMAAAACPAAETREGASPLAFGEGALDLALSGLTLHAENDPVGALVQFRRALRPDGLFLGVMLGGRTLHELRSALAEAEAEVEGGLSPRVAPMADLRDVGALLQRAGFAMPVADAERLTVDYPDALALMRDLRAMGEANALAGRRRGFTRRATLLRAAALYAEAFGRPDGRIPATFELVFMAGWSPGPGQPTAKRPGSASVRLADALGVPERPAGEKAG
jgi:SAM-dependent methyltransferase